jgi:hypothetical protein
MRIINGTRRQPRRSIAAITSLLVSASGCILNTPSAFSFSP